MRLQHLSVAYPLLLIQLPASYAGLCIPKSGISSAAEYTTTETSEFGSIATTLGADTYIVTSATASESTTSSTISLISTISTTKLTTESTTESLIESTTSFSASSESTVLETQLPITQSPITTATISTESPADTQTTTTSEIQTSTACTSPQETEWAGLTFYSTSTLFYAGSYVVPSSGSVVGYTVGMDYRNAVAVTYNIDSNSGRFALTNAVGDTYWLGVDPASSVGYYQMTFWPADQIESLGLSYVNCARCSSGPLECTTDGTNNKVYFIASVNDNAYYTTEQLGVQGSGMSYVGCYANGTPLN